MSVGDGPDQPQSLPARRRRLARGGRLPVEEGERVGGERAGGVVDNVDDDLVAIEAALQAHLGPARSRAHGVRDQIVEEQEEGTVPIDAEVGAPVGSPLHTAAVPTADLLGDRTELAGELQRLAELDLEEGVEPVPGRSGLIVPGQGPEVAP